MASVEKKQLQQSKILTADDKTQLLYSVLRFLQSNQFSKSLKRLLKDAQIQGDSWEASTLDLEDIYGKYLGNCNTVDAQLTNHKELEMQGDKLEQHGDAAASQETVSKKNKKTDENDKNGSVCDSEAEKSSKKVKKSKKDKITSESLDQDAKKSDIKSSVTEDKLKNSNGEIDNSETTKSKHKKKKKKASSEPLIEDQKLSNSKSSSLVDDISNSDIPLEQSEVKPKEKKRKKVEKENKSIVASENGADDNDSKKRKRLASTEDESQPIEETVSGESKRRKIEGIEKAKNVENKGTVTNGVDERTDGDLNNGVEKSGQKKQQNGSAEPRTVNAFQRVKIDEVEFVDERLQDNSYWAKSGAEIGYGAKAQEILGQVRGRDFRHEKTKKKRGSYRGGQIDLQSHSVKFNYSDEE